MSQKTEPAANSRRPIEDILDFCVELSRRMIISGANLERVSLAVERICRTYQLTDTSLFLLSTHIILSARDEAQFAEPALLHRGVREAFPHKAPNASRQGFKYQTIPRPDRPPCPDLRHVLPLPDLRRLDQGDHLCGDDHNYDALSAHPARHTGHRQNTDQRFCHVVFDNSRVLSGAAGNFRQRADHNPDAGDAGAPRNTAGQRHAEPAVRQQAVLPSVVPALPVRQAPPEQRVPVHRF